MNQSRKTRSSDFEVMVARQKVCEAASQLVHRWRTADTRWSDAYADDVRALWEAVDELQQQSTIPNHAVSFVNLPLM
jgi:hypothetical protein